MSKITQLFVSAFASFACLFIAYMMLGASGVALVQIIFGIYILIMMMKDRTPGLFSGPLAAAAIATLVMVVPLLGPAFVIWLETDHLAG